MDFQRHGPQTGAIQPSQSSPEFDPEGEYIREWLPELRSVDTEFLLSGNISEQSATLLAIQLRLWITNNGASLKRSINSK